MELDLVKQKGRQVLLFSNPERSTSLSWYLVGRKVLYSVNVRIDLQRKPATLPGMRVVIPHEVRDFIVFMFVDMQLSLLRFYNNTWGFHSTFL